MDRPGHWLCRGGFGRPERDGRPCPYIGAMQVTITIAQDPAADALLSRDPFALLSGMLLDQQFPMEHAFRGPAKLLDRFGTLDPRAIAAAEPGAFADLAATRCSANNSACSRRDGARRLARMPSQAATARWPTSSTRSR